MMKRINWVLAAMAVAGLGAGCDGLQEPRQVIPPPETPNFTLYVSNQSFEMDVVDIEVRLDGELAVTGDFEVGSQHTWLPFHFQLSPGLHTLTSTTRTGSRKVELSSTVQVSDERDYGVLSFWTGREGATFAFNFMDDQPGFD